MPELPNGCPPEVACSPLKLFRKRPRTHLRNLLISRINNRRALKVCWAWLQGAKRGLPEIPAEFILAFKVKHAKALQKDLPPMEEARLADFQHELKVLWRGFTSECERSYRDEDGCVKRGRVGKWNPDRFERLGRQSRMECLH